MTFDLIDEIKRMVRMPSPIETIERDINLARHALLQHESAAEYHAAMIDVQMRRLARLKRRLQEYNGAAE